MKVLEMALDWAEKGFHIFPCKPDKSPYTPNGFKDATTNQATILKWWGKWPNAMIGMSTGKINNIWVLDIDALKKDGEQSGYDSLSKLTEKFGELPKTLTQKTMNGGRHYIFRYPQDGGDISNSAGKVGSKIDVRGDGGYIILAPSISSDGLQYTIIDDSPIAEAPDWLVEIVRAKKRYRQSKQVSESSITHAMSTRLRPH